MSTRRSLACAIVVALASACEPLPEPLPRVVAALPSGTIAEKVVRVEFTASEPLAAADVLGGNRVALCPAENLREVKALAEEGEPLPPDSIVATRVALEDGGRRAVLFPVAALVPGESYAAVFARGIRSTDGRLVLDPEGRARTFVLEFTVSPEVVGPVRAELTRVLADAEAPEAGGEYVEVVNLAAEPLDLAGFRLAKRGPSGAFTRCTIARRAGDSVPSGASAVVVGGAYDGRYEIPPRIAVYECGASAVAGGLANDRAPALLLETPSGATVSSLGVVAQAPRCDGAALVRVDASGPDASENLACSDALAPAGLDDAASREGSAAP